MRQKNERIRQMVRAWPMRRKMFFSYTIPVMLVCVFIISVGSPFLIRHYQSQLRTTIDQSFAQAESHIQNYLENMGYMSDLVLENREINQLLEEAEDTDGKPEIDEEYRVFFRLSDALARIVASNSTYRVGLYVPDERVYAVNQYYLYSLDKLTEYPEYANIKAAFSVGASCCTILTEQVRPGYEQTEENLVLLAPLRVGDAQEESIPYVARTSMEVEELREVMKRANSMEGGLVCLTERDGTLLCATDEGRGREILAEIGEQEELEEKRNWERQKVGRQEYYILSCNVQPYGWKLISLIPVREFGGQSRFIISMMGLILCGILVSVALISHLLSRYYVGRLANLNDKVRELKEGDLNVYFTGHSEQEGDEVEELYGSFRQMTDEMRRLLKEHYRLGRNVTAAELKALQAQINPHFLYNTIDLINWGAMECGAVEVAQLARNLGKFYRLSLNHGKSVLSIGEELQHVDAYVQIQNAHFEDAIQFTVDVPEEIRQYGCLNIILQPFVENAIVHGIAEHTEIEQMHIAVEGRTEKGDLCFTITDDGPGIPEDKLRQLNEWQSDGIGQGYGIRNINFRIRLCCGQQYGVRLRSREGAGTQVEIRLPILSCAELENRLDQNI